jgi:hypothetical protein
LPAGSAISTSWLSRWVPVPMTASTVCQHDHVASCLLPGSGADVGTGLGGVTGWHICDGSRQLADRLLIRPARWARPVRRPRGQVRRKARPRGQIRSESPGPPEPILAAVRPEPP